MKAAIIGSGNMGTALAHLLADNGHTVTCWDHIPEVVEDIKKNHQNNRFLPGVILPSSVTADLFLNHVVREAQIIFIAVPSPFVAHVVKEFSPFAMPQAIVVGTAKGLEPASGKRMSQVYAQSTVHSSEQYVALSGPAIANEFARKQPTAVVAACPNHFHLTRAAEAMINPYFRVETCEDQVGVELGGVLKNVFAIGFGLLDPTNNGSFNLKSAFLTLALRELKEVGVKMGGQAGTFEGLAGLGDLVTTGLSSESHNRRFGQLLASGVEYDKAVAQMGAAPEGVKTAATVLSTIGNSMDLPLIKLIQTSLSQPAARPQFRDGVWKLFAPK
jgi:glycerol-3-phosphate dehydrogenase (NAD(P)+)